jgi:large subunit ribosomal protein L18
VAVVPIRKLTRSAHRRQLHRRVRRKVRGTPERPRLAVFRSLRQIYAQLIDDLAGRTLASASSLDPEFLKQMKTGGNLAAAKLVGKLVGERARAAGLSSVVFDRGGYQYHGRVKALAEAAREAGLEF